MGSRFVFIVPCYNASSTIDQMFKTLVAQSYDKWRVILRDDMSTDDTSARIAAWQTKVPLTYQVNERKKWEVENIIEMLKECDEDEIVCRLDADDWLCDNDALNILDQIYTQHPIAAAWTAHRWGYTNHNISAPMPSSADPYVHPWVSSHLKTFRRGLLSNVRDENYRNADGKYFKRIGDQAIYLPALKQAQGRWAFIPIVAYHYTIDMQPATFQTDDAKFQKAEAEYLRARGFVG